MAINTIFLIIISIVAAVVLIKLTKKLIHTVFFITVVGVVFFLLKHFIVR